MNDAIELRDGAGPLALIERMATDPQCDPAKLREILAVQREWEAGEARKAFARALVAFQTACPIIEPHDTANGRPYARLDRIWRETRELRERHGLAVTWDSYSVSGGVAHLNGRLWHRDGHSQEVHQEVPLPDELRGQNAAQRSGSAETYARRYGTCAVLGVIVGNDDDGNAAGAKSSEPITPDQAEQINRALAMLDDSEAIEAKMLAAYKVKSVADIPAHEYGQVMNALRIRAKRQGKA